MSASVVSPNFRRRRFFAAMILVVLVALVSSLFQFQQAQATSTETFSSQTEFKYVSIRDGESLWSIAEKYAPNSDPREFIQQVISLNQLQSSEVVAGQSIALP